MFFQSWTDLVRVIVVGVIVYSALIFLLRVSGKRSLSKWNAFDFVVTIALGSTFASVLVSNVPLAEGVLAFVLLLALQWIITWSSVRSQAVRRLIKAQPTLLLDRGEYLRKAMKSQRVTESEILAAIRSKGIAAVEDVGAVVLETDGSFSVIEHADHTSRSALSDVANFDAG